MIEVIGVRFRGGWKEYDFDPRGIEVRTGQDVIVETAQGTEYARCASGNHTVDERLLVMPLRPLVRLATEEDRKTLEGNRKREKEAFGVCEERIAALGLDMKLVRVESNFDGSKILFFFTSDGRVDFRELVRELAAAFHARIELRQIGVRDEAKMIGGIGICGRPFCCAQFLDDFMPVSIKMAKTQSLSLNPAKISGTCGRLMCCLKYEQDAYEDAARRMPKPDSFVLTPDGTGTVLTVDLLRECVSVRPDDQNDTTRRYHNCEIVVLRNGKGSRDGIVIPSERPARYRPETEEVPVDRLPTPAGQRTFEETFTADGDEPAVRDGERRRGHRGGRNRRRGGDSPRTEAAGAPRPEAPAPRTDAPKPPRAGAPKPPRADAPEGNGEAPGSDGAAKAHHRPHHRGGRNHRRGGGKPNSAE